MSFYYGSSQNRKLFNKRKIMRTNDNAESVRRQQVVDYLNEQEGKSKTFRKVVSAILFVVIIYVIYLWLL